MARVPAWVLNAILWGDLTLQAAQFADDANPHRVPNAGLGDISINSLIADYLSQTDTGAQTVAGLLTTHEIDPHADAADDLGKTTLGWRKIYTGTGHGYISAQADGVQGGLSADIVLNSPVGGVGQSIGLNVSGEIAIAGNNGSVDLSSGAISVLVDGSNSAISPNPNDTISLGRAGAASHFKDLHVSATGGLNGYAQGSANRRFVINAGNGLGWYVNAGDSEFGVNIVDGGGNPAILLGPGGSTTPDVRIERSAGNIRFLAGGQRIMWDGSAFQPITDAARDIGAPSFQFRDIYASRRAIIAAKNALVLDGQSMTQASHTISNADTDIATYSLGTNTYTHVIVRVTGYVSFGATSTNQVINLKLKDGTTQVGNTMVVDGAIAATAAVPFALEAAFVETGAVTIHVTEGAAAADANTTVFINSIIVFGES